MNLFGNFYVAGRRVGEILNVKQGVPMWARVDPTYSMYSYCMNVRTFVHILF